MSVPEYQYGKAKAPLHYGDSDLTACVLDMASASKWLFRMFWHIFVDLNIRDTQGRSRDEFEISTTIYKTGSINLPAMASQNRSGHISGSTPCVAVGMCHRALVLLAETAKCIEQSARKSSQPRAGEPRTDLIAGEKTSTQYKAQLQTAFSTQSKSTVRYLHGCYGTRADRVLGMRSMADIVSVMVVLSCMEPSVTEDMVRSNSLQDWSFDAIVNFERRASESLRRQVSESARGWAVEEQAISVSCLRYSITAMSGCAVLVIGGLMAGFLVGSRIDGVDPFNLTMFA
ncbi:hypothetical protein F53441_6421 [Fusarium austroafricanum]|uniref:Uncharacterized protein n=1 Tax=Fusarium austroafricanum TaxID=2364996 RepID=A0A8H4P714_9HYPO|nr:hypothetical protein F53441_6421 [Fusarium austroafricanum]